jgi:hypothetical protein
MGYILEQPLNQYKCIQDTEKDNQNYDKLSKRNLFL